MADQLQQQTKRFEVATNTAAPGCGSGSRGRGRAGGGGGKTPRRQQAAREAHRQTPILQS